MLESCPRKSEDGHPGVREMACHRLQMADRAMNMNEMNYEQIVNQSDFSIRTLFRCFAVPLLILFNVDFLFFKSFPNIY